MLFTSSSGMLVRSNRPNSNEPRSRQIPGSRQCHVTMAIVTTLIMPPTLRWALNRLPIKDEEKQRLEREEYERQKGEGAVSFMLYGTPQTQALNQKLAEDKIPGTSPGFGISASADGTRYAGLASHL